MVEKPRRWFQFGLANFFWLMAVIALLLFAVRQRRELLREQAERKRERAELQAIAHKRELELTRDFEGRVVDMMYQYREELRQHEK